jgi:ABC-2 type transport system permease protein
MTEGAIESRTVPAGGQRVGLLRVFVAIVSYTLRSCVSFRRWLGVLAASSFALLFGLLVHTISAEEAFARSATNGIFALVVPIASLVIGDAVLGAEIRGGTFHFTWLSPAPMWLVVLGRWVGGCVVAATTLVPACALAAVVAGVPSSAGAAGLGAGLGGAAYVAVFIAIGCIARRAAVWSLAFVFLVERLLGAALTGIAQLSPTWESREVFIHFADGAPADLLRKGIPHGSSAIGRLALITAIALLIAIRRLPRLQPTGGTD